MLVGAHRAAQGSLVPALLALLCLPATAPAMTFTAQPPVLYAGGRVLPGDWEAWRDLGCCEWVIALIPSPSTNQAAVTPAGRSVGRHPQAQAAHRERTRSSACANIRSWRQHAEFALVDGKVTGVLGYHGSYNKGDQTGQHASQWRLLCAK